MTEEEILQRLSEPNVSSERLLEECRGPDQKMWQGNARLYKAFTNKLLVQGYPARALDLAREGKEFIADDLELQFMLALAARRGGNPRYAQSLLDPLLARAQDLTNSIDASLRVEILSLKGAVLKLLSRKDPAMAAQAAQWYEKAGNIPGVSESADGGAFPLINAATMWRLAGHWERSQDLATVVIDRLATRVSDTEDKIWRLASLGEAYLLLGKTEKSIQMYREAISGALATNRLGDLGAIRGNLQLLREHGIPADTSCLDEQIGCVVAFSGHMVDSPDRLRAGHQQRFPNSPGLIDAVKSAISAKLQEMNASIGFCSMASGGDLLFAKAMIERNAELHIVFPFSEHDFLRTSVNFGQTTDAWRRWTKLFNEVIEAVPAQRIRYATQEPYLGSNELFGHASKVQQGMAILRARERGTAPLALALIDRSLPGLSGGSVSFLEEWLSTGNASQEIDLRALRESQGEWPIPKEKVAAPTTISRLKRPVRSMLFADVAGFSGIPEWSLAEFLADYAEYLKTLFASKVGQAAIYANTWGDGIYAVFEHVADAASFALELVEPTIGIQPVWADFDLGETVPIRVGLHSGPVFELPDLFQGRPGYGGQHVNRAARIEPATVQGCAYASEAFAALLTVEGGKEFHIESVGLHSLAKGYDRSPLYRIGRGG